MNEKFSGDHSKLESNMGIKIHEDGNWVKIDKVISDIVRLRISDYGLVRGMLGYLQDAVLIATYNNPKMEEVSRILRNAEIELDKMLEWKVKEND